MLIATLPTVVSLRDLTLVEQIFAHPLIGAARYNTGGDSPLEPMEIIRQIKLSADRYRKPLYIDLEGRQMRVAEWTPFDRGSVVLNRDFEIELPGKIFFRGAGWREIVGVNASERKVYFEPFDVRGYYLGKSQSVHVVAKEFIVKGYLGGLDSQYISAASQHGVKHFMLSFVESLRDLEETNEMRKTWEAPAEEIVLKIESRKGVEFVKNSGKNLPSYYRLMAARDDLFLNHVDCQAAFFSALQTISIGDSKAIVASWLLNGLRPDGTLPPPDVADIMFMRLQGYEHFMLSDEMSRKFDLAMTAWKTIIQPVMEQEEYRFPKLNEAWMKGK